MKNTPVIKVAKVKTKTLADYHAKYENKLPSPVLVMDLLTDIKNLNEDIKAAGGSSPFQRECLEYLLQVCDFIERDGRYSTKHFPSLRDDGRCIHDQDLNSPCQFCILQIPF